MGQNTQTQTRPLDTGIIKVNQKMPFIGSEIWKPPKRNIGSGWKVEIKNPVSDLRFVAYFNVSFNLFPSTSRLLVFSFLEDCYQTQGFKLFSQFKLKLKYKSNLRFEAQINFRVQTQKKNNPEAEFQVYFNRPIDVHSMLIQLKLALKVRSQ